MNRLSLKAPAKLNLHLQVVRKRKDNFHDIKSVFQLIDLYDELTFEKTSKNLELKEKTNSIENNLVLSAATILKKVTNCNLGAKITLRKKIPVEGGLGGGSSDAATTLIALNKLWKTNLSKKKLSELALQLGSDVPFFIHGKNSWAEGRGEILKSITLPKKWFIIAVPKTKISTKLAFQSIDLGKCKKDQTITLKDFENGITKNSFLDWVRVNFPELEKIFLELQHIGNPRLTGTGSSMFLSFNNQEEALNRYSLFPEGILVKSIDHSPLMQLIE